MHLAHRAAARDGADVVGVDNFDPYYDVALKRARADQLARAGVRVRRRSTWPIRGDGGALSRRPIHARRASRRAAGRALFAGESGSLHPQQHRRVRRRSSRLPSRGVAHLVYASSSSVYGANHTLPFSEDQSVDHPVSLYAATKKANELMAHSYSHLFGCRRRACASSPCTDRGAAPTCRRAVHARDPRRHADQGVQPRPDAARLHLHRRHRRRRRARAFARARRLPAPSAAPYAIYNIGNHTAVELETFIGELERLLGKRAIREYLPLQPGDVPATFAAIDRLAAATGFAPTTPLAEGLARFVAWYRDYYRIDGSARAT